MELNADHCYEAIKARDTRFDGVFFVGVSTTRIYCRPVCRVRTPGRDRCTFYRNAASAEAAGYRPCLRCRPELAPGAAPMDAVRRVAGLAVARIEAGYLSDADMEGLATEFSISSRQLRRVVEQEYGVTPVELAQTRRLLLAKQLLTDTQLRMADVAFASGFASVRRFNHLFRTRYGLNPTALRRGQSTTNGDGAITLKLGYRPPLAWPMLSGFLTSRGATCTERLDSDHYIRTVRLNGHVGWIDVTQDEQQNVLRVVVAPTLLPVLPPLLARLRGLFDLDANPTIINTHLTLDRRLAACVRRTPGLRVPGAFDGFELALRAVLGQQISVKAATTVFGRFAQFFGEPIETPFVGLDRTAPSAATLADARLDQIIERGLTRKRAETIKALARAVADGRVKLDTTMNAADAAAALDELPGIGPWTIQYIAMRALRDPDAFPASDLGLLKALALQHPKNSRRLRNSGARGGRTPRFIFGTAFRQVGSYMTTFFTTLDSPVGELLLIGDGDALTGLYMHAQKYARDVQSDWRRATQPFIAAAEQLRAYFAGALRTFDLPLAPHGTAFQRTVWRALLDVPFGRTESYGALARRIDAPAAARAVGLANGHNPIGIIVPCHRVIGANGSLTGYGGGIERKRWLLAHEARHAFTLADVAHG